MQLIDLSHTITEGMVTFKGLPGPHICDYLSRENSRQFYDDGSEFQIGSIEMVANTGTYVDCPFHRYAHGKDLNDMALRYFADLPGILVRSPFERSLAVDVDAFLNLDVRGKAVLVHTGWDAHWGTGLYYENHSFLTAAAATFLREQGAALVGIDSHNIDDTRTRNRPVHTTLLGADIPIVEHLCNLQSIPDGGFYFSAVPPKVKGMGTFPVRAYARL